MSNEFDLQDPQHSLGVISGFDIIDMSDGSSVGGQSAVGRTRTAYSVDELYVILRELKKLLDPESIARIDRVVQKHVAEKNAHGVSIDMLVTSVINELYLEWLRYTNRTEYNGSYSLDQMKAAYAPEQFLKIIFQGLSIADVPTTIAGTSASKVVSPKGAHAAIDNHNTDMEAHGPLLDFLFPGSVHTYTPSMSFVAGAGVGARLHIEHTGFIDYMGADGLMHGGTTSALPVDWSTGVPAYPIFGATANYAPFGTDLQNAIYSKNNITLSDSVYTSIVSSIKATKVQISDEDIVKEHSLIYTIPAADTVGHTMMCVSIFARPGTLDNIAINAYKDTEDARTAYHYNLTNMKTYVVGVDTDTTTFSDHYAAEINATPSGLCRCTYVCPITEGADNHIAVHFLDIFDGDLTYKGRADGMMYITGLQIEFDTDTASPYMHTTGTKVTREPIVAYVDITDSTRAWYNAFQSGIAFEVSNIKNIRPVSGIQAARYVFDARIKTMNVSAFSSYYQAVHNGKLTAYFADKNGVFSMSQLFDRRETQFVRYGVGYANTGAMHHGVESPSIIIDITKPYYISGNASAIYEKELDLNTDVNQNVDRIYIGCSATGDRQLNGYLSEFIYYPTVLTKGHMEFYTKG